MVFKCVHYAVMLEETVPTPDPGFAHSSVDDLQFDDLLHLIWKHPSMSRYEIRGFSVRGAERTSIVDTDIDIEAALRGESDLLGKRGYPFDIDVAAPHGFMDVVSNVDRWTLWDMYRYAVEDYSQRKLTYDSDAVNAFAGVAHFIGRGTNTKFLVWTAFIFARTSIALVCARTSRASEAGWQTTFPKLVVGFVAGPNRLSRERLEQRSGLGSFASHTMVFQKESAINHNYDRGDRAEEQNCGLKREATGEKVILEELDIFSLRFLGRQGEDGWVVKHDMDHNRHIYSHTAYPGVKFTYAVNLPGQNIGHDRVSEGTLAFYAHVVLVKPCNMEATDFKMELEDRFLQLGINDENRSASHRPAWKRIVYHQGYRAGFLTLNHWPIPMGGDVLKWHLAAITRGSLPNVPPPSPSPSPNSDFYWSIDPRMLQAELLKDEWKLGPSRVDIRPPRDKVEPSAKRPTEDGDPHWDTGRFNEVAIFDVYDVLLLCTAYGQTRRLGAGKISCCAFAAAQPEEMDIMLG